MATTPPPGPAGLGGGRVPDQLPGPPAPRRGRLRYLWILLVALAIPGLYYGMGRLPPVALRGIAHLVFGPEPRTVAAEVVARLRDGRRTKAADVEIPKAVRSWARHQWWADRRACPKWWVARSAGPFYRRPDIVLACTRNRRIHFRVTDASAAYGSGPPLVLSQVLEALGDSRGVVLWARSDPQGFEPEVRTLGLSLADRCGMLRAVLSRAELVDTKVERAGCHGEDATFGPGVPVGVLEPKRMLDYAAMAAPILPPGTPCRIGSLHPVPWRSQARSPGLRAARFLVTISGAPGWRRYALFSNGCPSPPFDIAEQGLVQKIHGKWQVLPMRRGPVPPAPVGPTGN